MNAASKLDKRKRVLVRDVGPSIGLLKALGSCMASSRKSNRGGRWLLLENTQEVYFHLV
jgi:hypothetical protein